MTAAQIHDQTPKKNSGRRWAIGIGIGVLALVVLAVIADIVGRQIAEDRIETEIAAQLPENVQGEVTAEIEGFSFLSQYFQGRFEKVNLASEQLVVNGAPMNVQGSLHGVTNFDAPKAERMDGTVSISEESANSLINIPMADSDLKFDEGKVEFQTSIPVLGSNTGVTAEARPIVRGKNLIIAIDKFSLGTGGTQYDAQDVWPGDAQIQVCLADRIPKSVTLDGIDIRPGTATFRLTGSDLDVATLGETGSC